MLEALAVLGLSVLSGLSLAIMLIWPGKGPTIKIRKGIQWLLTQKPLKWTGLVGALDCYFCLSFWTGLAAGTVGFFLTGMGVTLLASILTPLVVWAMQPANQKWVNVHRARPCKSCNKPQPTPDGGVNEQNS